MAILAFLALVFLEFGDTPALLAFTCNIRQEKGKKEESTNKK